eukprot:TRINITY_DN1149_c0_g2_i1.p1 TRINITY_DN1149_c0_g2~~TRINITY_DN1149_c0_g2_i1.p1  ORF type:complete len:97 (-),score=12.54 TRINITY_DN1149_c0_g2_i1:37-327(-)
MNSFSSEKMEVTNVSYVPRKSQNLGKICLRDDCKCSKFEQNPHGKRLCKHCQHHQNDHDGTVPEVTRSQVVEPAPTKAVDNSGGSVSGASTHSHEQ